MTGSDKKYWKGLDELNNDPAFLSNAMNEFPEFLPISQSGNTSEQGGTHRRDFLKMLGFGVAAVSLAACEAPVKKAIPYLNKPEDVDPGVANWYASSYLDGGEYCSILVKTREGRPIKIEGNKFSSVTKGGISAKVQASVLSLYDKERLNGPRTNGQPSTWESIDADLTEQLNKISLDGGQIRIVSSTLLSPSSKKVIADFMSKFPTTKHITYDAVSGSGILKANQKSFGKSVLPSYDFSKAKVIVSIGADFLGTWLSPVEYARQYAEYRKIKSTKDSISQHFQFETNLSLSGANADFRTPIKPSQEGLVVAMLYKLIGGEIDTPAIEVKNLKEAADALVAANGYSLVVSGSNDPSVQVIVNAINDKLTSYGKTVDISTPSYYKQGDDATMVEFVNEVKSGNIAGVIFYNTNPVYTYPSSNDLKEGLKKVSLSVSFATTMDETASEVKYVCPDHHYLESWNDAEPRKGAFSLVQPTISPIFKTRMAQESLLKWTGVKKDFYNYIQEYWKSHIFNLQSKYVDFNSFWDRSLHNGVFETKGSYQSQSTDSTSVDSTVVVSSTFNGDVSASASDIAQRYKVSSTGIELALYEKIGLGTGNQANNPWLQELPDPISKATWDNYLTIPISMAEKFGIKMTQGFTVYAEIKADGNSIKVPLMIQPGQAKDTVGLAIGYGRTKAGKVANGVGVNAYQFANFGGGFVNFNVAIVTVTPTSETYQIALTQTHQTIMGRDIVQEVSLKEYKKLNGNVRLKDQYKKTMHTPDKGEQKASDLTLWSKADWDKKRTNHFWGMVIDLNSCIGCGSCVIGCQAENNVPVVGRDEVRNSREMHWIRIDRYYSSAEESKKKVDRSYSLLENPAENPQVLFQPMMCQHCNNAPCETVCPVLATTHSTEGLNQMTYNRCIGTRYCANNCPYKVRRFNWFLYYENDKFDYNMNNDLGKMVLNPDVTVRARGVMEKCSMCVQRIQEGKLSAKRESRRPIDGEIETACSQSCPTEAIVFGDMNDPESRISKVMAEQKEGRLFNVLEEINTHPSVSYLTKVRNTEA